MINLDDSEGKIVEQMLREGWLIVDDILVSPIPSGKPSAREKKVAQALRPRSEWHTVKATKGQYSAR